MSSSVIVGTITEKNDRLEVNRKQLEITLFNPDCLFNFKAITLD